MNIYNFEPVKSNAGKVLLIFSFIGWIIACTQIGLKWSIYITAIYIFFVTICVIENTNFKKSRFELHDNKLDYYIKKKLVKSFDLTIDPVSINTFDHGRVLVIIHKKKKSEFHENVFGKDNFDRLIFDMTGRSQENNFTDFTQ